MKKGFTLIELLVVIAIIGILASIVMVSMSGATASAKDARVKGAMGQVRTIAELINNVDGDYDDVCLSGSATSVNTAHSVYGTQLLVIQGDIDGNASSGATQLTRTDCIDSISTWCYAAYLETGGPYPYYCIDSAGRAWATGTGTGCAAGHVNCL